MFHNFGELIRVLVPVAFGLLGFGLYFFILRPHSKPRFNQLFFGILFVCVAVGVGYFVVSFLVQDFCCTINSEEEQDFVMRPPIEETQYPIPEGDFESRVEIEPTVAAIEAALLNRDEDMVFCTRIEEGIPFGNIYLGRGAIRFSGGNLGLATERNRNGLLTVDKLWIWPSGEDEVAGTVDQLNEAQYAIARESILSDLATIDFRCGVKSYSPAYFEPSENTVESRSE